MEGLFHNDTEMWNFTEVTEVITEIVINFTEVPSEPETLPASERTFVSERYFTGAASTSSFSSEKVSLTSKRSIADTTVVFHFDSSCRPGFPETRQVCRDLLFYPYVASCLMVAFGFIFIAAIVMNSLVLFVMVRSNRARKSSHNVYVASLAFSDLMVVLIECPPIYIQFLLPGDVSENIYNQNMQWMCITSFFFNCFFGTASIMTQLALNIDRYCMIIHPLTTRAFATPTKTRAGFILVLVWSISMIPHFGNIFLYKEVRTESYLMHDNSTYEVHFCLSRKPGDNPSTPHVYTATVFCIFYLSTLVTTISIYVKIVTSLQRSKPTESQKDDRIYSIYMRRDSVRVNRHKHHLAASRNILRIMGCSVLSYCFCYSVYFYINLYYIYFGFLWNNGFTLLVIANMMGALNALVNPTIFACFSHEFKKVVCSKYGGCRAQTKRGVNQRKSLSDGSDKGINQHSRRASVYAMSSTSSAGSLQIPNVNGSIGIALADRRERVQSESTTITEIETET